MATKIFAQIDGGYYQITNLKGLALDADDPHITENGCKVHLWSNIGGRSQTWKVIPSISGGIYEITLAETGLSLNADIGTQNKDGGSVRLWSRNIPEKQITQRWTIYARGDGTYNISLTDSGKRLDCDKGTMGKLDGKVQLWGGCNNCSEQKWLFKSVPPPINSATKPAPSPAISGIYRLLMNDGGLALDADEPHITENGCKVHLWNNIGGRSQNWKITSIGTDQVGDNIYEIQLVGTTKVLDAYHPNMNINGCKIQLFEKNGDVSQHWKINSRGDGSYTITLAETGKILEAKRETMYNPDGIVQLYNACSANSDCREQRWVLFLVDDENRVVNTILPNQLPTFNADLMWNKAMNDQLGIIGSDFRGQEFIGTASFERASHIWNIPDNFNFWYPQMPENEHGQPYKKTLSGTILEAHIAGIKGKFEDFDMNIDIKPLPNYLNLLTNVHQREYTDIMALQYKLSRVAEGFDPTNWGNDKWEGSGKADCNDAEVLSFFTRIEAEVDAPQKVKNRINTALNQKTNQPICVYGPWVYDRGHCCQPEIHPAEQIWWKDDNADKQHYTFSLICDASERFWWRDQMDNNIKLKPWGAPPIIGTFAIAFEVQLGQPTKKFTANSLEINNVKELSNNFKTQNLVWNGQTIVSFNPGNAAGIKVSYEFVGLKTGTTNVVRGFLVLETTVGKCTQLDNKGYILSGSTASRVDVPWGVDVNKIDQKIERQVFKKEAGHYMFTVIEQ